LGCLTCLLADGLEEGETSDGVAPVAAVAGERFGDFEVARDADGAPHELGHGAMGTTYLARDTVLDRPVALKVIGANVAARPGASGRFLREAKGAAALRHPNVASIFQYGVREADGQPFYAMEFIEGETLEQRVRREGPLPVAFALEIAAQIGRALGAAEARGLVHRDLKPSNVMLTGGEDADHAGEPHVKVIDFGLAKTVLAAGSTNPGASQSADGFVGTPAFASPEQFAHTAADPGRENESVAAGAGALDVRSDIFSLGVTLWYLFTGQVPFVGRTLAEIHERQTRHPLPVEQLTRAGVPAPVVILLRSLLAPDPAARPQNARELAAALRVCRQKLAVRRRTFWLAGAGTVVLALATALVAGEHFRRPNPPASVASAARPAIPEKSVAVLPFANLSTDPANAFLADGMQDEILADLALIADLKVISRTSVMAYRDAPRRNVRDISRELGVAYVLEGSVAREGNQVRVTAQLIDARTDAHVWAERYDRPVDSFFAIEDEVAEKIATRLQVRLSADERNAINEPPTTDLAAYGLYLRADDLYNGAEQSKNPRGDLEQAVQLLEEAIRRDPRFYRAFCLLSGVHITLFQANLDRSATRMSLAREALARAQNLRPDAGETHYAAALFASWSDPRDQPREAAELALARVRLPNSVRVFWLAGIIAKVAGDWQEAIRALEHASALDPRDELPLNVLADIYGGLHRYADVRRVADRGLAMGKDPFAWRSLRAGTFLDEWADPGPLLAVFAPVPLGREPSGTAIQNRFDLLCLTRDFAAAERMLAASQIQSLTDGYTATMPRAWFEGFLARYQGNEEGARRAFTAALDTLTATEPESVADATTITIYARLAAVLGRKEEALRKGRLAYEKEARNTFYGPRHLTILAQIEAWTGEPDAALGHLAELVRLPYGPSYGDLRLDPDWDTLRGDPRFEALCRELAPAK
jgi:TolB-like protein/Tfp pilus assembly protein PilF